ncbi:MAG: HEAT repeat domain-containing protein [Polyangiales bacterium]
MPPNHFRHALFAAVIVSVTAHSGWAQPRAPRRTAGAAARVIPLRDAVQMLHAANPDEVREGVAALTRLGTAEVVPPLVELIESGLSDSLLDYVVEQLGFVGRAEAIPTLSTLLHHRRTAVRRLSVSAMKNLFQRTRDARVPPLLESALRDSDRDVRGEAATALGDINARASLGLLQRAFDRNVPEASVAIGRVGDFAAAQRLMESIGRTPLSVLIPGFEAFMARRDLTDDNRHTIVETLVSRSPTRPIKEFLQRWVQGLPPNDRSRARQRAMLAIRQIRDDAPASGGAQ